jgi:hypothetical protein
MEKTYNLDQKENAMLMQIDQERTQALAAVGALSLDMEQARKNLDNAAERQRSFIRQALSTRGVEQFQNARAQNGALIVTLPEPMPQLNLPPAPASPLPADGLKVVERVNGPASDIVKE